MSEVDWNKDTTSALVSIGTHSLFLRAAGPPRQPGVPVVVVEAGLGDSSVSWTAVARHVSPFARIYTYDRSGLGQSEASSLPRLASNSAMELSSLLTAAKIEPPYIVVMHSYGAFVGREFLAAHEEQIAGMVFVDTITEFSRRRRPEKLFELLRAMFEGVNSSEAKNVAGRHGMTAGELAAVEAAENAPASERAKEATSGEFANYMASVESLEARKQFSNAPLGKKPVSVVKGEMIRDMKMLYEAAIKRGNGTAEQRRIVEDWLKTGEDSELKLQEEQLQLSTTSRLVRAEKSGHDVQLFEPKVIAGEIKWILEVWDKE